MKPLILMISLCVNFSPLDAVAQNIQLKEDGKAQVGVEQNRIGTGPVNGHVDAGNNGENSFAGKAGANVSGFKDSGSVGAGNAGGQEAQGGGQGGQESQGGGQRGQGGGQTSQGDGQGSQGSEQGGQGSLGGGPSGQGGTAGIKSEGGAATHSGSSQGQLDDKASAKEGADPNAATSGGNEDSMNLNVKANGTEDGSGSGEEEPTTMKEIELEEAAEENPDLFEGDIKIPKDEVDNFKKGSFFRRDAVTSVARLWPNGRVPYRLASNFDWKRKQKLRKAIAHFNNMTCIRVVPKTNKDKDFITFIVGRGCYSTGIGKRPRGGEQKISIGEGCNWVGTIVHEIMHAIGFFHEQSRLDRDQFINIYWQNIKKGMESQFWNYAHGEADYLGEPYDFDSVMHYHRTAFSFNNENPTIVAKDKPWRQLGQRKGLSPVDASQVNKLYKCKMDDKEPGNNGGAASSSNGRKTGNMGNRGNNNSRGGSGRGRRPTNTVKILRFFKSKKQ